MTHRVGLLTFDGMTMLDATGPAEVFHQVDPGGSHYELVLISPGGGPVSAGPVMGLSHTVAAVDAGVVDTLLVAGGGHVADEPIDTEILAAAEGLAMGARRVASVCTGAFILAELGLLDGRRATTHWRNARALALRYPRIAVVPDVIHVQDGRYLTSAGITAGIDLALAMVEEDLGAERARDTARELVMFMQRPGGQSQFSTALSIPPVRDEVLRALVDGVVADPAHEWTVESMAAHVGVSVRHLNRLFHTHVGTTPARWLERVRVDAAQTLVLEGRTLNTVARLCGLGTDETLRRAFIRQLGTTPSSYRERFTTTRAQVGSSISA